MSGSGHLKRGDHKTDQASLPSSAQPQPLDQPPARLLDEIELEVAGESAQLRLGARLAELLRPYRGTVYLRGDLGAGKTTLVRGLLRGLGYQGAVRSPTYTLIEPYETVEPPVVHLDLYRLADPEELDYLGLRDLLEDPGLILVEWPERGAGALPPADLELQIADAGERRRIRVRACPRWAPVVAALSAPSTAQTVLDAS